MNFKLGEELHIAGRFIYNGLRSFHEMENLHHEDEVFEVLYNLSVGLERLLKVAVVLVEHEGTVDQEKFEQSLITHSHLELLKRIMKSRSLALAGPHNALLEMLGNFYKTHRYGRYGIAAMKSSGKETIAFHEYIEKQLNIEIANEPIPRIKKFLGRTVGKIASELYETIRQEAGRRNIYTYELRYDSKAAKIFLRKEYDFSKEDVLWRELLVFFVNSQEASGHLGFMKKLEPLTFDSGLDVDYLQCIGSDEKKLGILDELDHLYEGVDKPGERLDVIRALGDPSVVFDPIDKDDEDA